MEVWNVDTSQEDLILDSDGDGIPDYYEVNRRYFKGVKLGSDPFNPDTDGDGLLDGEEVFMKTDEKH